MTTQSDVLKEHEQEHSPNCVIHGMAKEIADLRNKIEELKKQFNQAAGQLTGTIK